jgi:NitT/TauT family transport system substrate-binding protein
MSNRLSVLLATLLLCFMAVLDRPARADPVPVRIGVLEFGTVNWELDTIKHYGLDIEHGIRLDTVGLAGRDATTIALRAGEVDVIVIDWVWVSR